MSKLETEEMRDGNQPVDFMPAYEQPSYIPAPVKIPAQPGLNLRDALTIAAMQGMISRVDGGIFNPDEVADKACLQAEAMLRRMP